MASKNRLAPIYMSNLSTLDALFDYVDSLNTEPEVSPSNSFIVQLFLSNFLLIWNQLKKEYTIRVKDSNINKNYVPVEFKELKGNWSSLFYCRFTSNIPVRTTGLNLNVLDNKILWYTSPDILIPHGTYIDAMVTYFNISFSDKICVIGTSSLYPKDIMTIS
jgi:hypothetical protein